AIGFGLPTAPIHLGTLTIVLPLVVGTGVAILAAIGPAFRATRVPPIAALREGAELPPSTLARHAPLISTVLLLLGLGGIVGGAVAGILGLIAKPLGLLAGLVAVCLALFAVVRIWLRTETEWPPEEPSSLTTQLARENTARNPGRTAVTSSSLMIGVALVVFVAVFVNGFKDSFLGALDRSVTSDLIIQS